MKNAPCFECLPTYTFAGTAYVGSNAVNVNLGDGYYQGFIGCMQDVYFDYDLMIPEKTVTNPALANSIQVNTLLNFDF